MSGIPVKNHGKKHKFSLGKPKQIRLKLHEKKMKNILCQLEAAKRAGR